MNRVLVLVTVTALLCAGVSLASAQQAFKTPDEAAGALVSAAKTGDRKALDTVLGPDGEDIVSSGDEVADAATRQKFVAAYNAKHQVKMDGYIKATMVIGPDDFPPPDPSSVKMECGGSILPLAAKKFSSAELEKTNWTRFRPALPMSTHRMNIRKGPYRCWRQDLCSTDRKPTGKERRPLLANLQGEHPSPLGSSSPRQPRKVIASREDDAIPRLSFQDPHQARPGRFGRRPGLYRGWQHDWWLRTCCLSCRVRKFGSETFICGHSGTVYEKDLGPNTAKLAERMSAYNPDKTWTAVKDTEPVK